MNEQGVRETARELYVLLHGPGQLGRQDQLRKLSRALMEALNEEPPVPMVRARRRGNQLVVDCCPYCYKAHYHSMAGPGGGDIMQRAAGCLRGEYVLEVKNE